MNAPFLIWFLTNQICLDKSKKCTFEVIILVFHVLVSGLLQDPRFGFTLKYDKLAILILCLILNTHFLHKCETFTH